MEKHLYKLSGEEIIEVDNLLDWGKWYEEADTSIDKDQIDDILVSTVFLGINHAYDDGDPVLFETMFFGGVLDQQMRRYTTIIDARLGHFQCAHIALLLVRYKGQSWRRVKKKILREIKSHGFDLIGYGAQKLARHYYSKAKNQ